MRRFSVALILLAASATLSAQASVFPSGFGTVRAGETVKIEWRRFPREVEELELLLTVDGREFPVRVTQRLAAGAGLFLWRVPNLPSRSARLTIRFGLDGEEIENAPSAPFEILPAENEAPAVVAFRDGEWWAQEAAEDRFPGTLKTREDGDRIREGREGPACAGSPQTTPTPSQTLARGARSDRPREAASVPRLVLTRKPTEVPARI